jgi:FHS family L-fucose permease-like MFS transporter
MILGRFIGSFLLLKVSPRDLVGYAGCICLSLLLLSVFTTGNFSYLAITCIGLFNSIMFPTIYTLSVNGLGRFSIYGSAVLIMAISGGALIPFIVRNFSYVSYEFAFLIVGICYFYIILYGWKLSRYQKKSL